MELKVAEGQRCSVVRISAEEVGHVAELFDAYRRYYGQAADVDGAGRFLAERLQRGESVVFAILEEGRSLGFTQLYPSFSSVSMRPIVILNDLFVVEQARRCGLAARLLSAARDYAVASGAVRMTLSTGVANFATQTFYVREGWRRDDDFVHYEFDLGSPSAGVQVR